MKKLLLILGLILTINITAQNRFNEANYLFRIEYALDLNTKEIVWKTIKEIILQPSLNKITITYQNGTPTEEYRIISKEKDQSGGMEYTAVAKGKTFHFVFLEVTSNKSYYIEVEAPGIHYGFNVWSWQYK